MANAAPFRALLASCLTLSLIAAWTHACAPQPLPVPLPTPQVARTPWVPPLIPPSPSSTPSPTPPPEAYPPDYADLYYLARQVYGEKNLPRWVSIPALNIESLIVPVGWQMRRNLFGKERLEWDSPGPFVGWAIQSALPGTSTRPMLLYGHNNLDGSIFRDLYRLKAGDLVLVHTLDAIWSYRVEQVQIIPVAEEPSPAAFHNSALVIISCYPPNDNSQRVIVKASLQTPR